MRDAAADSANKISPVSQTQGQTPDESTALQRCYGQIGISAVAAAVRYQGSAKNPAYAPASNQWRDQWAEVAA